MAMFQNPGEDDYAVLLAETAFIHDIQLAVEAAMDARGLSQADLAKLLGVSAARVSHILSSNGRNLQARSIARIAHVLGLKALVEFAEDSCGWVGVEIDEGDAKLPGHETFDEWVSAAYAALDSAGSSNDNKWKSVKAHRHDDLLVAA